MKRLLLLLGLLLLFATPQNGNASRAVSKAAYPVTITDDLGTRIKIAHLPRRILSLDPRDTETLFALGLEKRLVGDGSKNYEGAAGISRPFRYPTEWPSRLGRDYPLRAKQLPHIEGGCCGVPWNIETVASLHPDLVFALDSDLPSLTKMRDLGLKVIVIDPTNFRGILRDIRLAGTATGASKQAAVVIGEMNRELKALRKSLKGARKKRTYYEIDGTNASQPYIAGPGTYVDEAISLAAGKNVAHGITYPGCPGKGCYPSVAVEALVRLNPQVILLGDAAYGTTLSSVKARPGWETIDAVRKNKIYPFNDDLISRAGPRIASGIRALAYLVHPEVFRRRR